ncbi:MULTISPECIES: hypothetical protein [Acidianus]|uniref:Uncharacterized protein n=1 Tax=Candidatus Acidianus copahuensis TaxID=1160895 RepID=A0A031LS46_9CREN|nr:MULTISPECIES: hypothetical protein [Acidianus]EZQ10621.1 hypothetical protein CM19_03840 [Candidatus Acidianus copahuensis]NON63593.1 hypothetical protein [Acidianus sp. RZ1]
MPSTGGSIIVHIGIIGILFAALIYFDQYEKNPGLYYTFYALSVALTATLLYFLIIKPAIKYFNF